MIFVTVGAQMPFDRLVGAVDAWALASGREDVFAQVGPTTRPPLHMAWTTFMSPNEFRRRMQDATVVVGHAGMGTILSAMQYGKPLVMMPRRGSLRETRNEHQVATAEQFDGRPGITVALDEHELLLRLNALDDLTASSPISPVATGELLTALRSLILPDQDPATVVISPAVARSSGRPSR